MLSKNYAPRRGDVLLVRAIVAYDHSGKDCQVLGVKLTDYGSTHYVERETFEGVYRIHLTEGIRVIDHFGREGTVLAVTNDHAWVAFDNKPNEPTTISRQHLTVLTADEIEESAQPAVEPVVAPPVEG